MTTHRNHRTPFAVALLVTFLLAPLGVATPQNWICHGVMTWEPGETPWTCEGTFVADMDVLCYGTYHFSADLCEAGHAGPVPVYGPVPLHCQADGSWSSCAGQERPLPLSWPAWPAVLPGHCTVGSAGTSCKGSGFSHSVSVGVPHGTPQVELPEPFRTEADDAYKTLWALVGLFHEAVGQLTAADPGPYAPQPNPGPVKCTGVTLSYCFQPDDVGSVLVSGTSSWECIAGASAIVKPTRFTSTGIGTTGSFEADWSIQSKLPYIGWTTVAQGTVTFWETDKVGYFQTLEPIPTPAGLANTKGGDCSTFRIEGPSGLCGTQCSTSHLVWKA